MTLRITLVSLEIAHPALIFFPFPTHPIHSAVASHPYQLHDTVLKPNSGHNENNLVRFESKVSRNF